MYEANGLWYFLDRIQVQYESTNVELLEDPPFSRIKNGEQGIKFACNSQSHSHHARRRHPDRPGPVEVHVGELVAQALDLVQAEPVLVQENGEVGWRGGAL